MLSLTRHLGMAAFLMAVMMLLTGCFLAGPQVVIPTLAPNATVVVDAQNLTAESTHTQTASATPQPTRPAATETDSDTARASSTPRALPADTYAPEPASTSTPAATAAQKSACSIAVDADLVHLYTLAGGYAKLGCAVAAAAAEPWGLQLFERGWMFWRGPEKAVYAALLDLTYTVRADSWDESQPERSCDYPAPANLQQPKRGFGLVWCSEENTRNALGYAQAEEYGAELRVQRFENGMLVLQPDGTARVLNNNHTWAVLPTH